MTDKEKLDAIRAEIDSLQKPTMDATYNFVSDYNQGFYDGLSQLELFIESLPKEKKPIREYVSPEDSTLGKLLKEMKDFSPQEDLGLSNEEYNDVVNELIFGKEEPVSKDLEEVASQYSSIICYISPQWKSEVENIFKAGAQWGKEQAEIQIKAQSIALPHECPKKEPINKDLEEAAKNHKSVIHIVSPQWTGEVEKAFKAGAEWQKGQMIDKTCEYFYQKLNNGDMECGDIAVFIENFKNYMKGE